MQRFHDLKDLYNTILPALNAKEAELHRQKFVMISKDSIWNYLLQEKWIMEDELDLSSIIDDIMNVDGYKISKYIKLNKIGGTDYEKEK